MYLWTDNTRLDTLIVTYRIAMQTAHPTLPEATPSSGLYYGRVLVIYLTLSLLRRLMQNCNKKGNGSSGIGLVVLCYRTSDISVLALSIKTKKQGGEYQTVDVWRYMCGGNLEHNLGRYYNSDCKYNLKWYNFRMICKTTASAFVPVLLLGDIPVPRQ